MEHLRQLSIFDPTGFNLSITLVGCGSIGSVLGPMLVRMGMQTILLYDNDRVEEHNIPLQYFAMKDIGHYKATKTAQNMNELDTEINTRAITRNFTAKDKIVTDIVILATDSIASRKMAYERTKKSKAKLLIDGRMAGEDITVFTIDMKNKKAKSIYEKTFHKEVEQTCTARGIIYTSNIIGGIICSQLKKVLNNEKYEREVNFSCNNYAVLF